MEKSSSKKSIVNEFKMPVPRWMVTYPAGPYFFKNREYFIVSYETDREMLEAILPPGLELIEPVVKYEFIRMPDSTGFGDYTESGQIVPVRYKGEEGTYTISMFLDCHAPIAGGREIWGFPKKLAKPKLCVEEDTLVGVLKYGSITIATATMGYKHHTVDSQMILKLMQKPVFLLKNIPGPDGNPQVNQLVRIYLKDITIKGAWTGPCSLEFHPHAMAPVGELPIHKVLSCVHFVSDLTLPYGEVVEDYLLNNPRSKK